MYDRENYVYRCSQVLRKVGQRLKSLGKTVDIELFTVTYHVQITESNMNFANWPF